VKAGEKKLNDLLHAGNQFVIPVFQRDYVWKEVDWERLWDDIGTLREADGPPEHFMGSIVSVQMESEPGQIPRYLIIDGQQRLITFAMLLSALRDEATRRGVDTLPEKIQRNYLTHEFEKDLNRYKILPRLRDRTSFFQLVDGHEQPSAKSRVFEAYSYFMSRLAEADSDAEAVFNEIFTAVTAKLSLVTITLDRDQNAFAIFATLNATGQKLEEADLIRNFVFMDVPLSEQDQFDNEHWLPFETSFDAVEGYSAVSLTAFYRDFLEREGKYVRRDDVYVSFQHDQGVKGATRTELLELLRKYADLYLWIERPALGPTERVRRELARVKRLDQSTAYPLVLNLLYRYRHEGLSEKELIDSLRAISSFVLRRAMTNWSTRAYGRQFTGAIAALEDGAVLSSLTLYLARKGWPDDPSFLDALVKFPVYRRWPSLTRLMLVEVENPDSHKEKVEVDKLLDKGDLSIEHVMPQSIGDDKSGRWWQAELGDDWKQIHAELLHSIGNLTLTGYNTPLSNRDFLWKQGEFAKSNLRLNDWFGDVKHWTQAEISNRGRTLAKKVVALWPEASSFEPKASEVKLDPGEGPVRSNASMAPIRREFWESLAPVCEAAGVPIRLTATADSWLTVQLGLARGTAYVISRTSRGTLAAQYESNWHETETVFNWLRSRRDDIKSALGQTPTWLNSPGKNLQSLEVSRYADLGDRDTWPETREWVVEQLEALATALRPLVGAFMPSDVPPEPTLEVFLDRLEQQNPHVVQVVRRLTDWASREMSDFYLTLNRGRVSLIPVLPLSDGRRHHLVRLMTDGTIEFRFRQALKKPPFDTPGCAETLLQRANTIPLVNLPREVLESSVTLPLAMMQDSESFDGLLSVLNWFVDKAHGDGHGAT
jgi:uncharacterized protein with ParB-like and HNH nuclease domain